MQDFIQKNGRLEEKLVIKYVRQILKALEYLHAHDPPILHRDIKTDNILLDENSNLKLADFGCANSLPKDMEGRTTFRGTIWSMAPEIING